MSLILALECLQSRHQPGHLGICSAQSRTGIDTALNTDGKRICFQIPVGTQFLDSLLPSWHPLLSWSNAGHLVPLLHPIPPTYGRIRCERIKNIRIPFILPLLLFKPCAFRINQPSMTESFDKPKVLRKTFKMF